MNQKNNQKIEENPDLELNCSVNNNKINCK